MNKIYGTLNLPGSSVAPNGRRLQSTTSGQLIVLTKWTIYVLASVQEMFHCQSVDAPLDT